jgi:hypothetical protein
MAMAMQNEAYQVEPRNVRMLMVELLVAVLIVILAFSIVLGITSYYFPIGTGVKELAYSIGESVTSAKPREMKVSRGAQDSTAGVNTSLTAMVSSISNRVNVKLANDIAWGGAQVGMSLHHRDAIQTYERSRALVEFDEQSYLDIGENSLVVFQSMEPDLFAQKTRTFRVTVEGELRGRLLRSPGSSANLEVALPNAEVQMVPGQAAGDDVEFKLTVNPDKTSTLSVHKGNAELLVGGKRVNLQENYGVTIDADGQPMEPVSLPSAPVPKLPTQGSAAYYRDVPPRLRFSWKPTEPTNNYRIMLARDPQFRQVVVDEQVSGTSFTHGNLKGGQYYWRVQALAGKTEGTPSEARELTIVQDRTPPVLYVQKLPKVVHQSAITLRGKTEPGARIFVEGTPVAVDSDGTFQHRLYVKPGASLIVIEAVDSAGNVAYATNLVNGKY